MSFLHSGRRAQPMQAEHLRNLELIRWRPLCTSPGKESRTCDCTVWSVLVAAVVVGGCSGPEAVGCREQAICQPRPVSRRDDPRSLRRLRRRDRSGREPLRQAPAAREITIPAGTLLRVTLDTPVGFRYQPRRASRSTRISRDAIRRARVRPCCPPARASAGVVTDATRSAKVKGRAHVALRFDSLTPRGDDERYAIRTASIGTHGGRDKAEGRGRDRRAGRGRRDDRRAGRRQEGRARRHRGRRRRRHGGGPLDARQGSAARRKARR